MERAGWMKDNGRMDQMGWLKWEYYPMYAQYLVKYVQSYQSAGVPINYVSVQNEPNCCQAANPTAMNYPGMSWNPAGLVEFTKDHLYPAGRPSSPTPAYAMIRSSVGSPGTATSATRPSAARSTTPTRRSGSSAPNTPAAPGSATSTTRTWPTSSTTPGTGHLTRFVKPGAVRIASTASTAVPNVAWRNPDGSKALIAHNGGTGSQSVRVNWGTQSFVYTLPARTTATFTWSGTGSPAPTGTVTGLAGECADVAGANAANGTAVQLYTCNGTAAQQWSRPGDGTLRSLGKCLDVSGPGNADGTVAHLWDCHTGSSQKWTVDGSQRLVDQCSGKCLDVAGNTSADGTRLQIWACTTGANQKWTLN